MPFTPFHFGPGAALHALTPRQISFLAFCAANVLIDIEPGYYLLTGQYPLHRFCHTVIGAALIVAATLALFAAARACSTYLPLPNLLGWKSLRWPPVVWGALSGSYSHILLDSIMHSDIRPLAPFSQANPLWLIASPVRLHQACLIAGLLALLVLALRSLVRLMRTRHPP